MLSRDVTNAEWVCLVFRRVLGKEVPFLTCVVVHSLFKQVASHANHIRKTHRRVLHLLSLQMNKTAQTPLS